MNLLDMEALLIDQSITEDTLEYLLTKYEKDIVIPNKYGKSYKEVIDESLAMLEGSYEIPNLYQRMLGDREIYLHAHPSSELLLRRLTSTLKKLLPYKQSDRDSIVKSLISNLRDPQPFSLTRLDVKKFYESIDYSKLMIKLKDSGRLTKTTRDLAETFGEVFSNSDVDGLPRGLSISAMLSELYMADFDSKMKSNPDVFFYGRFVDDIVILSISDSESVSDFASEVLPEGLVFNFSKSKIKRKNLEASKKNSEEVLDFSYLGYRYVLFNSEKIARNLIVRMSENKVNRYKSRVVMSFVRFSDDDDMSMLKQRLRYLTSNYNLINRYSSLKVKSGIYYSYKYINSYEDLFELDKFLLDILFQEGFLKELCGREIDFTLQEKRQLVKYSFRVGFEKKLMIRVSVDDMRNIKACWI